MARYTGADCRKCRRAKTKLYLKGAELTEMHPVSTLPATHLLNITLFSYAGTLYFGLIATDALPNLGRLAAYVEEEIATLEEAVQADLLLHVVDAANPDLPEQMAEVQKVLAEIGADTVPQLLVFNKLDALEPERYPLQMQDQYEQDGVAVPRVFLSAKSGKGLDLLRSALSDIVKAALPPVVQEPTDPRDFTREYPGDLN